MFCQVLRLSFDYDLSLHILHVLIEGILSLKNVTKRGVIPVFDFTFEVLELLLELRHPGAIRGGKITPC